MDWLKKLSGCTSVGECRFVIDGNVDARQLGKYFGLVDLVDLVEKEEVEGGGRVVGSGCWKSKVFNIICYHGRIELVKSFVDFMVLDVRNHWFVSNIGLALEYCLAGDVGDVHKMVDTVVGLAGDKFCVEKCLRLMLHGVVKSGMIGGMFAVLAHVRRELMIGEGIVMLIELCDDDRLLIRLLEVVLYRYGGVCEKGYLEMLRMIVEGCYGGKRIVVWRHFRMILNDDSEYGTCDGVVDDDGENSGHEEWHESGHNEGCDERMCDILPDHYDRLIEDVE